MVICQALGKAKFGAHLLCDAANRFIQNQNVKVSFEGEIGGFYSSRIHYRREKSTMHYASAVGLCISLDIVALFIEYHVMYTMAICLFFLIG